MEGFESFGFNRQLLNAITDLGYQNPTPVQQKAIPPILNGQDVIAVAQTGTGKTAAYLLPLLMRIKYAQGHDPRALIIVPTRELVLQLKKNIDELAKYTDLRAIQLYGGVGPKTQKEELLKGCDILVSTPGRFWDLYREGVFSVKKINTFILDEADRLMDMGFLPQIHQILEVIPRKKQNLLFTATLSPLVKKIIDDFIEQAVEIHIRPEQKTAVTVSQKVFFVPNFRSKLRILKHLLEEKAENKVMIFCRTRGHADEVLEYLDHHFPGEARVVHSNKDQNARINAVKEFDENRIRFLVATDVAARGIDINNINLVINFDVPVMYQEYVHRIGRTGRAEKTGDSITFCNIAEEYHLLQIEKLISQKIPTGEIPPGIVVEETPFEEKQAMKREIDSQRRKEDPDFKGAFHEKKKPRGKSR